MSSVPARSNLFGGYFYDEFLPTRTRIYYDPPMGGSSDVSSQTTARMHRCLRGNPTTNPAHEHMGILGWRNPSSYNRIVRDLKYTPASYAQTTLYSTRPLRYKIREVSGYSDLQVAHEQFLYSYPIVGGNVVWTDERGAASTKALLSLNTGKVNLGQAIAEARESLNTVADLAVPLFRGLLDLKHGRVRAPSLRRYLRDFRKVVNEPNGLRDFQKGVASGYLSYQYGWKPLMSDLYGAYDEYKRGTTSTLPLSAEETVVTTWEDSNDQAYWVNRSSSLKVINTCGITARIKVDNLARANALGLVNPVSLAWEVVPFSFVVDWVMPIGSTLQSITAPLGLDFVGGFESQTVLGTVKASRSVPAGYVGEAVGATSQVHYHDRVPLGGFPVPQFYTKSPFSTSHTLSALALFRQLIS